MRRHRLRFALIAIPAIFLFGFLVMMLWNALMPAIFGLKVITYWQTLGLLLLAKIFFGSFHGGRGGHNARWRERVIERWEQLTPEEREKFRESMRRRGRHCHGAGDDVTPNATPAV